MEGASELVVSPLVPYDKGACLDEPLAHYTASYFTTLYYTACAYTALHYTALLFTTVHFSLFLAPTL